LLTKTRIEPRTAARPALRPITAMKLVGATWRLLRASAHAVHGFWIIKTQFPKMDTAARQARVETWSAHMLRIARIELVVTGQPPQSGPLLLVANHISWLDILVIHAARHCRFISKSDIQTWPVIGTLADGGGTLYVERTSRRDAHRMVGAMAERLRAGDILAVFPEGTTSDGRSLKPFHANLIQAAIDAAVPVQPTSLSFIDALTGEVSVAPAYIDDDTLVASVWRTLTAPPFKAVVAYGDAQRAEGRGRREWASALQREIAVLRGNDPADGRHRPD
jgi:1-acyl-sn-glycerol-3-phosphate acyltransferase